MLSLDNIKRVGIGDGFLSDNHEYLIKKEMSNHEYFIQTLWNNKRGTGSTFI